MEYFSFIGPQWKQLDTLDDSLKTVSPIDGRLEIDDSVRVKALQLPMYDDVKLLSLTSENWTENLHVCYLSFDGNLFRLNGTSPPIHEVNAKAGIKLNDDNLMFYLTFFCYFVRGDDGPFYVVSTMDDPLLPEAFKNSSVVDIDAIYRPPRRFGFDSNNHWRISALIYYSNNIFLGDFVVQPSGMIELTNDQPLFGDLHCKVESPLAPVD